MKKKLIFLIKKISKKSNIIYYKFYNKLKLLYLLNS